MSSVANTITSLQNTTTQTQAANLKKNGASTALGEDAFLTLMTKQLQYQDPMNPTSNDQMITEEAQFTQLSQLEKLNTNVSSTNTLLTSQNQLSQASSLIDKTVTLTDPNDSSKTITGKVSGATITSSGVNLTVNGTDYSSSLLQSISSASN